MMKGLLLALAGSAAVATTSAEDFCGLWDSTTVGDYIVYNNLWGNSSATSGGQCTGASSIDEDSLTWHTAFNWTGAPYQVKSYANAALQFEHKPLSDISAIQSAVEYTYDYTGTMVANLAYDLFTSASADGEIEYEIMVWLAALGGAWPLSSSGQPIGSIDVSGTKFNLYEGPNGNVSVFSFVAEETTDSFSANLMDFVNYVVDEEGLPSSQYLVTVQAGTEVFLADDANLTVSSYTVSVN